MALSGDGHPWRKFGILLSAQLAAGFPGGRVATRCACARSIRCRSWRLIGRPIRVGPGAVGASAAGPRYADYPRGSFIPVPAATTTTIGLLPTSSCFYPSSYTESLHSTSCHTYTYIYIYIEREGGGGLKGKGIDSILRTSFATLWMRDTCNVKTDTWSFEKGCVCIDRSVGGVFGKDIIFEIIGKCYYYCYVLFEQ